MNITTNNQITKAFIFKVADSKNVIFDKNFFTEYQIYANKISEWICNNLTTLTIGEIAKNVNENGDQKYITIALSDEWKDKPMYFLFTDKYHTQSADNLLYEYITKYKFDEYNGNVLGISSTYYRRNGYFKLLMSNYRTKIRTLNPKIKRCKIDENSSEDIIEKQVIYEMINKKRISTKEWENYLQYLNEQENISSESIKRCEILKNFFIENEEKLNEKIILFSVEQLKNFGGCKMKSDSSVSIMIQHFTIEDKENSLGFILKLPINGKVHEIELLGNKQIKKGTKDNYKTLIDIVNNHGNDIRFKLKDDELYIIFSCDCEFNKKESELNKIIGIDVNIKHALMMTSEIDNGDDKNYVNIYKEILKHEEFTSLLTKEEKEYYEDLSKCVSFFPIETELLFERVLNPNNSQKEKVFSKILDELTIQFKNDKQKHKDQYISCVKKARSLSKSYYILKQKYSEKQEEYDKQMGFFDESTESKETMDKRRFEFPFINTDTAKEILQKMKNISQDIDGCKKNIMKYAYNILENQGFDTIVFENLENSNFEKIQPLPTINSILKFHKIKGKTIDEAIKNEKIGNLIQNNYYEFELDDNNRIINAFYSEKGSYRLKKALFMNQIIKTFHFASIKDEGILLSNNNKCSTVLVPAEYSSQMDSTKNVIYGVKKNGKLVKADKRRVRAQQEKHINKLNADFNAAKNLKYIVENETWRNVFCAKPKNYVKKHGYSMPLLEPTKKGQHKILSELKKLGAFEELCVEK